MELIFIGALTTGLVATISVLFWNIRRSRCTKCATPCCTIERELMSAQSLKEDQLKLPEIGVL